MQDNKEHRWRHWDSVPWPRIKDYPGILKFGKTKKSRVKYMYSKVRRVWLRSSFKTNTFSHTQRGCQIKFWYKTRPVNCSCVQNLHPVWKLPPLPCQTPWPDANINLHILHLNIEWPEHHHHCVRRWSAWTQVAIGLHVDLTEGCSHSPRNLVRFWGLYCLPDSHHTCTVPYLQLELDWSRRAEPVQWRSVSVPPAWWRQ